MIATDIAPDPNLPLPLSQSAAYAATLRAMGHPVWQSKVACTHALVSRAAGCATTIRGPVWGVAGDPDANLRALKSLKLRLIDANADAPLLRRAGYSRVVSPATVAEWDLTQNPTQRRAALHGKWRNALRQGEAASMRIEQGPFRPLPGHWMYTGARALARARNFRQLPLIFTDAFTAANPGNARLWAAYDGKRPVAGMVFLRHGPVATYHIGWTSDAGRAARAHHVLLACAANWLADHDTTRLDLGLLDTEQAPGLARFKLGTGATARTLGGSWIRLPGIATVLASMRTGR